MLERLTRRCRSRPGSRRGAPLPSPSLLIAATALLLAAPTAHAQSVERRIEVAAQRLAEAQAAHADIIAPGHFERAAERIGDARRRYEQGGRIQDIDRRLAEAHAELDGADRIREVGALLLRSALAARSDAVEANAPDHAASEWDRAERTIREAGRRLEGNDQNGARERAARAEEEFRAAELNAIRSDVLGRARTLQKEASAAKADRRAPLTHSTADSLLRLAERVLLGDRYQRAEARELAEAAAEGYRRAMFLGARADSVDSGRLSVEKLLLRGEAQLARIAEALGFTPHFDEGEGPMVDQALDAIRGLRDDRAALERDVESRGERIADLERQLDVLDARLAALEDREAEVAAALRERERRERRMREVRAVFTPDEAEVILSGDRLILRLLALTFPSGSDEIRPANFSLLTKVQRVIREFPDASIEVEGHTDAVGNEASNQALSRRRAIAIREYLLANMVLSADRITAVGYGESRPIASNQTEEGKARNRRIEVALRLESE